jgi:hypothetical protein
MRSKKEEERGYDRLDLIEIEERSPVFRDHHHAS